MHIILAEFERRRREGLCKSSREAEATHLAAWHQKAHPDMPQVKAKTIRNKLPADFQPFKGDCPKL
jgi:hypothetical protein